MKSHGLFQPPNQIIQHNLIIHFKHNDYWALDSDRERLKNEDTRLNMQPGLNTMPGRKCVWELECLSMRIDMMTTSPNVAV